MGSALEALRGGGKRAVARALAEVEIEPRPVAVTLLLDEAFAADGGHVVGLTGPPGVGKSTLVDALIRAARAGGRSVAVVAVDPSSRLTGGALLGDRARISTDPDDAAVFLRSMAARGRLGGLSDAAIAATVLMRAVYDLVIVESVGVGQSEGDVAEVCDTIVLCVQPGSGDALQFMKAGIMELPDIVAVTKADVGAAAIRARADVAGALSLGAPGAAPVPVLAISAATGAGIDDLVRAIEAAAASRLAPAARQVRRARQARAWLEGAVRAEFGRAGLARLAAIALPDPAVTPFAAIRAALEGLSGLGEKQG